MIFFFTVSLSVRLFYFYSLLFKIILNFKKNTKIAKNVWKLRKKCYIRI